MSGFRVKVLLLPVEEELVTGIEVGGAVGRPPSLHGLVEYLAADYPLFRRHVLDENTGLLRENVRAAVNGNLWNKPESALPAGAEVVFFPAIAGG